MSYVGTLETLKYDLKDEKRIGKAKVANPVLTQKEVYEKVKILHI